MTTSSSTTHDDYIFLCECDSSWMRSACRGEIFYKEHDGKRYCVLHYPNKAKLKAFQKALQLKLDNLDFDFQGVWFPEEVSFRKITFSTDVNFRSARFNAGADFNSARFGGVAYFMGAQFNGMASFTRAQFSGAAYFERAQFAEFVEFSGTRFSQSVGFERTVFNANVNFHKTRFIEEIITESVISDYKLFGISYAFKPEDESVTINFAGARFKDGVNFEKNEFAESIAISFAAALFEKPERATFRTISLSAHWFLGVDSRKFNFIDVRWHILGKGDAIRRKIAALDGSRQAELRRLLEITYRQLAVNAEENNRYEEAANLRYMAMEMKRLYVWRERQKIWGKYTIRRVIWVEVNRYTLSWFYWLLSGYGERVMRALMALLTIWLLFAVIYWTGNATWWQPKQAARLAAETSGRDKPPAPTTSSLTLPEAIIYSAGVLSLQKPEPLPANKRAKALVLFETILGPLQAALLALAIRRKFMR